MSVAQAFVRLLASTGPGGPSFQRFAFGMQLFGNDVPEEISRGKLIELDVRVSVNFTAAWMNDAVITAAQAEASKLGLSLAPSDVWGTPLTRMDFSGEAFLKSLEPVAEFRKGVGITSSGGFISRWADQSGRGNDAVQSLATNQPTLSNGSALCDGIDNFLKCALVLAQPIQFYLKGKQVTWTLDDGLVCENTANTCAMYQAVSTPRLAITADAVNFLGAVPNTALVVNTSGVIAWCFDGMNSSLQVDNNAPEIGNAGTTGLTELNIGAGVAGGSAGNLSADHLIVYNANHDAATKAKLMSYLASLP